MIAMPYSSQFKKMNGASVVSFSDNSALEEVQIILWQQYEEKNFHK